MTHGALNLLRENILALLAERREQQQSLAFFAEIDPSTLSKFLRGQRELMITHLDKIAEFFGKDAHELFRPGGSSLNERRINTERRVGERRLAERRVGATVRLLEQKIHRVHQRTRQAAQLDMPKKKRA